MPQATDLVINDGLGTPVARTFVLLSPGGFGQVAEWVYKLGLVSTVFPRWTARATRTANASNKLSLKFTFPSSYVDPATGLTRAGTAFEFNCSASVPDAFPEALRADAVAFVANGISTVLLKSMIKDGLPAT